MSDSQAKPKMSPETASLLSLIDKLDSLLERSDLVEIEVEAGETGIVLRKTAALAPLAAPPALTAAAAGSEESAGEAGAHGADSADPPPVSTTRSARSSVATRRICSAIASVSIRKMRLVTMGPSWAPNSACPS